jgi:hypothetical protein
MQFYSITDEQMQATLVAALIHREREIHSYDVNITNYETILTTMPTGEWPDLIASYKGMPIENVPEDLHDNVTTYSFRDRVKGLLATEKVERSKSAKVYDAIVAQLPADQIPTLVAQALAAGV